MTPIDRIVNLDGSIDEKELSTKDVKYIENLAKESATAIAEQNVKSAKRAELLDKLGITEEEARLLLG